jgi:hypothetical protein
VAWTSKLASPGGERVQVQEELSALVEGPKKMAGEVDEDVLTEILARLPCRSLARF